MTGATFAHALLFCLFSFLFGVGTAVFRALLYAVLAAVRLLPSPIEREKKGNRVLLFFGYLLFDISFFVFTACAYMIFLYAVNDGIFRVYSLLFVLLSVCLLWQITDRLVNRPLFRLLSLPIGLLEKLFRRLRPHLARLSKRSKRKTQSNLTKAKKYSRIKSEQQKAGKSARASGSKHDRHQHTRTLGRLRR